MQVAQIKLLKTLVDPMRILQCEILKELNDAKVSIFVYKQVLFLCSEIVNAFRCIFVTRLFWLPTLSGYRKNVPGVACSVNGVFLSGGKAVVIHLSRWFFMINRTYEGKLKAYEVRTL